MTNYSRTNSAITLLFRPGLSGLVSRRGVFLCERTFSPGGRVRLDGFNIPAASDQLLGFYMHS